MKNKIKKIICHWILKKLGYTPPIGTKWEQGYIRFFNILSYPKEGWINTFHNYDDQEELMRDLAKVFSDNVWGPMLPKNSQQIVIKKKT